MPYSPFGPGARARRGRAGPSARGGPGPDALRCPGHGKQYARPLREECDLLGLVMRRIGAMGSLAAARGLCGCRWRGWWPRARARARRRTRSEGIGSVAVGAAPNIAAAAMAGDRLLHHLGGGLRNGVGEARERGPSRSARLRRAPPATAVAAGSAATGSGSSAAIGAATSAAIGSGMAASSSTGSGDLVELRIGRGHFQRDSIEYGLRPRLPRRRRARPRQSPQ